MTGPQPLRECSWVIHMELDFWKLLPLLLAAPTQLGFTLVYSLPFLGAGEWWRDFVGRALFVKAASLSFVLTAITINTALTAMSGVPVDYDFNWTDLPIYQKTLYVGYWGISIATFYQFVSIMKLRFKGRPFGDKTDIEGR